MSMLRFMPAKLVHETHRCKLVGQTANYGDIRLCVWTKCKDLGRMTKQKSTESLAGIKYYTYLCRKQKPTLLIVFGIRFSSIWMSMSPFMYIFLWRGKSQDRAQSCC